jgi:lipopolysaccharide transport system ATP-binding protein
MTAPAITAEGLGKRYRVSALSAGFKTWREGVNDIAMLPIRAATSVIRKREPGAPGQDTFVWAIRDVGFEVKPGRALGIVGHNGAGKSTLVKVLSRITEPTEGRAVIEGRVGSLLEVSAGFHPELTGRENVFLNGAVLGMTRNDVRRRFDEIVEFAGVQLYLDTPVKRYSSGMAMRLAFSVAAHLEPEVLIVDEVLAVGDTGFHKQCLDKMAQAVADGRTVIFISHNLAAVTQLCTQGLLLDKGRVAGAGTAAEVVSQYLATGRVAEGRSTIQAASDGKPAELQFTSVSVAPVGKEPSGQIDRDDGVEVVLGYDVFASIPNCQITVELWDYSGVCVLTSGLRDRDPASPYVEQSGSHIVSCRIPADYFRSGMYSIGLEASTPDRGPIAQAADALSFEIVDLSPPEAKLLESERGAVRPLLEWSQLQGDALEVRSA